MSTSAPEFDLTADHIATLRKLPVLWDPYMEGGMVIADVSPVLPGGWLGPRLASALMPWLVSDRRRRQLDASFAIHVALAKISPGLYEIAPGDVRDAHPGETRNPLPRRHQFEVTMDHLKLLAHANAGWDPQAGLVIDPKRPFGEMSYFEIDMASILGVPLVRDAKGKPMLSKEQHERFESLCSDMPFALSVLLKHGAVEPGRYSHETHGWRKRGP